MKYLPFRRKLSSSILGTLTIAALPATALSATSADFESRIAQLEAMIEQLEGRVLDQGKTIVSVQDYSEQVLAKSVSDRKPDSDHKVTFGGYIKADSMFSNYSDGNLAPNSAGRQFYIPGTIPVGGSEEGSDTDFQASETRFNMKTVSDLDGHKLTSFIELDFFLSPGGNERVSNSFNPRLRHAFVKYDNWLVGQTWSTFQDVGALAENLDFVGPSEGTTFVRQPQIRYTNGGWQIALENPETTVTPFGGGGRIVTDDGGTPDVVARYTYKENWGYLTMATIARQLDYDDGSGIDDSESSFGVSISGKILFGRDDLRFMVTNGSGLGRYLGLNTANGAVLNADGKLEAIDSTAGFISYRHFWNDQWRSNLTFSAFSADNDTALTGTGVTKEVQSVHANLLYAPTPKVTLGGEYVFAERELESGLDGDMGRLILSAKYVF